MILDVIFPHQWRFPGTASTSDRFVVTTTTTGISQKSCRHVHTYMLTIVMAKLYFDVVECFKVGGVVTSALYL